MVVSIAFLKSMPLEMEAYDPPPLFEGKDQKARWGISKPPYGIATASNEWYRTLRDHTANALGKSTSSDKSVCGWGEEDFAYNCRKCLRGKCIGNSENGFLKLAIPPGQMKSKMRLVFRSRMLMIRRCRVRAIVSFLAEQLGDEFDVKVFDGYGGIYSSMGITKPPIEFIEDVCIFWGANTFRVCR